MINTLHQFCQRYRLYYFLGILVLSVCIWFIGPLIAVAGHIPLARPEVRFGIMLVLLLGWGINNLIHHPSTPNLNESAGHFSKASLIQLHKAHKQALKALRKKCRRKNLAWFVVLGSDQSGKTSLIAQAHLSLHDAQQRPLQVLASTKNCTWWLLDNYVFLEIDESIKPEAFHSLLTKLTHLRHDQFRSIVLTIEHDLLSKPQNISLPLQQQLRAIQHLKTAYPIHLIITKCDQIAGFNEFFTDLGYEERNSLCGIILSDDLPSISLPQKVADKFDQLLTQLNQQVIWRLHQEHNLQKRIKIREFPLQLANLKTGLGKQLDHLKHNTLNQLRGIYLTSSLQQGSEHDYIVQPLRSSLPFDDNHITRQTERQCYFIKQLFHSIIQTKNTVATHRSAKHAIRYLRYSIALTIVALFAGLWTYSYRQNAAVINAVQSAITQVNHNDGDRNLLTELNTLHTAIQQLKIAHNAWYTHLGLSQSNTLLARSEALYQHMLAQQFYPRLVSLVTQQLTAAHTHANGLYAALRVYLMLKQPQRLQPQWVESWFRRHWPQQFAATPHRQQQLQAFFHTLFATLKPSAIDVPLVNQVRQRLRQIPPAQHALLYLQHQYPYVTLALPAATAQLYTPSTIAIPAIYLRNNAKLTYQQGIPEACQLILRHDWVLGAQNARTNQSSVAHCVTQAKQLYVKNYLTTWYTALGKIKIAPFKHITQAAAAVHQLSQSNSPLLTLIQWLRDNTLPIANFPAFNQQMSKQAARLTPYLVIQPSKNKLLLALTNLSHDLSIIATSKNVNEAAFEMAKVRMQAGQREDAISEMYRSANQLPVPLNQWLTTIANNSWHAMLSATRSYLNSVWTTNVLPQYDNDLDQRYPLFPHATQPISLTNFSKFFGPNGTINDFVSAYLKPFVNTSHFYWVWKHIDGQSIGIPQSTLEMFIRANLIRKMFFPQHTATPRITFYLIPSGLEPNVKEFILDLGGEVIHYQANQSKTKKLVWPGNKNDQVMLRFTNRQGKTTSLSQRGPWAWFRVLDKFHLQSTANAKRYQITFDLNGNAAKYVLLADNIINPFIPDIIDAFRCPERL